jgi:hypothetical protein
MIKMQACISFEGVVNIRAPGPHTNVSKFTQTLRPSLLC